MHGMPFSAVCGFGPDCMVNFGQAPAYVDVTHCVQIGGRDIDSTERLRMKQAGVTTFSINMIDQLGMAEVMRRAIEVAGNGTAGIHLSFDVDAHHPRGCPGHRHGGAQRSHHPGGLPGGGDPSPPPRSFSPWTWWRSTPSWTCATRRAFWPLSWSSLPWARWYSEVSSLNQTLRPSPDAAVRM